MFEFDPSVSNGGGTKGSHDPVITADFTMSDNQKKCCKRARIDRDTRPWFVAMIPRSWRPDPPKQNASGNEGGFNGPASADPDQPGYQFPPQFPPGLKYISPLVADFEWRAVCVEGASKGQTLSVQKKLFIVLGNRGSLVGLD